ncbi:hypothetical protein CPC08DRAFT_813067 [Agrocybe pediades]|nr:hypothetical protein CPC08DRAFT_813067 [Agrocybe pediades]
MPEGLDPKSRERSMSGDFESDFESHAGDSQPPGKPGRKKNPNSQAARRDQNRIAQREFRLRKQQRIRDLEARVEILSGGKDEALSEMRNMLKDLMSENQTLRNLLRSLATFIGEGAGGLLPKLGWNLGEFNEFINKSETDTAWEGYNRRKKAQQSGNAEASSSGQKRPADSDPLNPSAKKSRNDSIDTEGGHNNFPMMGSLSGPSLPPPSSLYSAPPRNQERNGMFSDLLRTNGSPMFMPSSATPSSSTYPGSSNSNLEGYNPTYMPGVNLNMEQNLTPPSYDSPASAPLSQQRLQQSNQAADTSNSDEIEPDDDPKKNEAYKLIHYHLENYKRNSSYCLPASLRPTPIQRTIPHESVVDCVLHPELRDRIIVNRHRLDLVDFMVDHRREVRIHGDDVLAHTNWELGENFIRKYSYLIDPAVLSITNRWRRERGDSELASPENSERSG